MKPPTADFGVTIDFSRGEADPVRVFQSLARILDGFRRLDALMIGALDPDLKTALVLEDVEAGSITAWARNVLRRVDDEALRDIDWRKQVGTYLVKAKHCALEYLDQREQENEKARLVQLRADLQKLASEPDFRFLPRPTQIELPKLAVALDPIQEAKGLLGGADRLVVRSDERSQELDLSALKKPSAFADEPVVQSSSGQMPMVLLVRRPDYLGDAQWEFRHGKTVIEARVRDEVWLRRFREGDEVVLPGSALDCLVEYQYDYDARGELVLTKHAVLTVHKVIRAPGPQGQLPGT